MIYNHLTLYSILDIREELAHLLVANIEGQMILEVPDSSPRQVVHFVL